MRIIAVQLNQFEDTSITNSNISMKYTFILAECVEILEALDEINNKFYINEELMVKDNQTEKITNDKYSEMLNNYILDEMNKKERKKIHFDELSLLKKNKLSEERFEINV